MASLSTDKHKNRTIEFTLDGKRPKVRLGKVTKKQAQGIQLRIEHLVASRISGSAPDDETSRWLKGIDAILYRRLANAGLVEARHSQRLGEFLSEYVASRKDVKSGTATFYGHTSRNLIEFFSADKPLRDITAGDADRWRLYLLDQQLADNTVRRRCSMAKQFFRAAVRLKLIESNPFEDLKGSVLANRSKDYFITREEAAKVLGACPDAQWRLLFALSRFGGLRCPSEHLGLRWQDVDWQGGRMTIRSPKTEHHVGGESRVIPIFPVLRPYLEEAFEAAEDGTEYVITRYRSTNANLRTQLLRIIERGGVKAWPKLFHNLRASRQTELAEDHPAHVVCAWIGNSQAVAAKHYLQVTEAHFAKALGGATGEAGHFPGQHLAAGVSMELQQERAGVKKPREMRGLAAQYNSMQPCEVGDTGFEPVTSAV